MAARLHPRHQPYVREKIRASQLVNRLENHVFGKVDMSPSQVTAALGLLRKCVPDLSNVEHTGEITTNVRAVEYSDDQLAAIATGRGAGVAQPSSGQEEPSSIH